MGCILSRIWPQTIEINQSDEVTSCERALHDNGMLMTNNDVAITTGGSDKNLSQKSSSSSSSSNNNNNNNNNDNQKRPRSFLTILLLRGRRGIQSVKIDTCASGRGNGQIMCDNIIQRRASTRTDQEANKRSKLLENKVEHNKIKTKSARESNSLLQMQQAPASGGRKRKSPGQSNSRAMIKMHIIETAKSKSESSLPPTIDKQETELEQSPRRTSRSVSSSIVSSPESQADKINKFAPTRGDSEGVILFTSVQQLCTDIIQRSLLQRLTTAKTTGRVLCLFIFGCQGSAKGEVAFELVEHSDLTKALNTISTNEHSSKPKAQTNCPLYHHIDVAAIIAANIDERIREYHQLAAQATTIRQEQVALYNLLGPQQQLEAAQRNSEDYDKENNSKRREDNDNNNDDIKGALDFDENCDNDDDDNEAIGKSKIQGSSNDSNEPSISSNNSFYSSSIDELKLTHLSSLDDESNVITLTTKQRSILQLKLMKYFNSVTSKWVFSLIQKEVERLELRSKQSLLGDGSENSSINRENGGASGDANCPLVDRVYLINLVPNQLSLFKSCLYLQQNFQLKGFSYPIWALKFERRTNIRLSHKERAITSTANSNSKSTSSKTPALRIPSLRLPKLNAFSSASPTPTSSPPRPSSPVQSKVNRSASPSGSSGAKELTEMASNLLADGVDKKLGLKFNDNFAQQFESMNKLSRLRYNPIRDYNYSQNEQDTGAKCRPDTPDTTKQQQPGSIQVEDDGSSATSYVNNETSDNEYAQNNLYHCGAKFDGPDLRETTIPLDYRPVDRVISSSMQHIVQANSSSEFGLDDIRHRLSLSRISPLVEGRGGAGAGAGDISHLGSPMLSIFKNQLTPSQVSSFLSPTSSLLSNLYSTTSMESDFGNSSSRISSKRSSAASADPIKWVVGLELYEPKNGAGNSSSSSKQAQRGSSGGDELHKSGSRWRGSSSAGTTKRPMMAASGGRSSSSGGGVGVSQPMADDGKSTTISDTIFFHEPKSSRSPLMFTAQHQRRPVSYQLTPVRVACANNQSQVQYELKRMHPPALRLKSQSDMVRLVKLIGKAKGQVSSDCQTWLHAGLAKEGFLQVPASHTQVGSSSADLLSNPSWTGKRHSVSSHHMHQAASTAATAATADAQQQPVLIVYVIRVDICRLKCGNFHYFSNFTEPQAASSSSPAAGSTNYPSICLPNREPELSRADKCLVPILALHHGGSSERELHQLKVEEDDGSNLSSGDRARPASSRSAISRAGAGSCPAAAHLKPKRHVQFRLSQAPQLRLIQDANDSVFGHLKLERRLWLEDCVYLSSDESNLETMEQLMALLRFTGTEFNKR